MPDMNGIELLSAIKAKDKSAVVLIITAFATWEVAVEAMRLGAFNYLKKPFDNARLRAIVARAVLQKRLAARVPERTDLAALLIGATTRMEKLFDVIRLAAATDMTVLIQGESGTGKELVAHALHFGSARAENNFIAVNCAAFPETLLESEFFGYRKGAFTGADRDKEGLLDAAQGGTLFIDEIGEMPTPVQAKFLRVLEEGEYLPLGSTVMKKTDVRFIASTNKPLEQEVEAGAFRRDLFFRLDVMPLVVPPLRERKEDIPLLAGHFLAKYSKKYNKNMKAIRPEAMSILMVYEWPGNVREFENVIESAVALAQGQEITADELKRRRDISPSRFPTAGDIEIEWPVNLERKLTDLETQHIRAALDQSGGNLTKAAELLGLSFRSLRYRIRKLGLK
jgi:two-component system response regulator PilR (NtrC family)